MKTKVLVCCHNESATGDDLLVTVRAGAALQGAEIRCDFRDDDGENISALNPEYNELTVLYWAWKNYEKLGDPDRIGLMHYRRFFYLDRSVSDVRLHTVASEEEFRKKSLLTEERLEETWGAGDYICPRPSRRTSVYRHYAMTHHAEDLDRAVAILKELFPDYGEAADEYLAGDKNYFFNMFIFPKEIFFRYAAFLFPILERYRESCNEAQRLFVSERLTGIFLHKLEKEGLTPVLLPVLCREGTFRERLRAFRQEWKSTKGLKGKARAAARILLKRRKESRRI